MIVIGLKKEEVNRMGALDSVMKKGQRLSNSANKQVGKVTDLQEKIIVRLAWIMQTQQKIADHLKIKLDDPLE